MSTTSVDDAQLLAAIKLGDERAMRSLYERHSTAIRAFAASWLKDEAQAADVVHDVMLDVWRTPDNYNGKASVRTWMFAITRNKSIDRLRRAGKVDYGDDGLELIDDAATPEEAVHAAQDKERVQRCLAQLPERQRTAIHLAFFELLTYPEIAAIEGVPVGTIKTRVHHAKKALATCLTKPAPPKESSD